MDYVTRKPKRFKRFFARGIISQLYTFSTRQKTENDTDSWYVCFLEYNPGEHEVEILKHWAESKNGQTYSCLVKRRTFIIDRMVGYSKSLVGKLTLLGLPKEEIWVGRAGKFSLILP